MANTYTLLETITVGAAGATSVTFNSIPQTGYTDLVLKVSARTTRAYLEDSALMRFNGDSGSNYTKKILYADGATPASGGGTSTNLDFYVCGDTATASTFGNTEITIPNYRSSNYKSVSIDAVTENNATTALTWLEAGSWNNTAAITTISLTPNSGTYKQYSTFSLYGVSALGTTPTKAPKATGGDIIMTDGTYWIHTFLSSGTFTPATALSCDYLVVAGGGGGGGGDNSGLNWPGGGGAGGYKTASGFAVTSGLAITVTVGAGGAGALSGNGTTGTSSVFSTITSSGGGGGAGTDRVGIGGGSGGGGGGNFAGGAGTSGQGNNGGSGISGTSDAGGGGGGAGSVGGNATTQIGGAGGTGSTSSISGASVTYAAGGQGSGYYTVPTAASGIGGKGGSGANAGGCTAGNANTGSGGGGGDSYNVSGGAGGSGLVIVRYLA